VRSSSMLRGRKDCGMTTRAPLALVIGLGPKCKSISLNYLPSGKNSRCRSNLLCRKVGRAKRNNKFWCKTRIMCTRKHIFPNHGIVWKAIEWPRRSFP
jgi:hypothetical protein